MAENYFDEDDDFLTSDFAAMYELLQQYSTDATGEESIENTEETDESTVTVSCHVLVFYSVFVFLRIAFDSTIIWIGRKYVIWLRRINN